MVVKDLMHRGVFTARADDTLGQIAIRLNQHAIHAVFVADHDDSLIGVVSDLDLVAGEWLGGEAADLEAMTSMTARELMTTELATIDAGADATEAAHRLRAAAISRLLVLEHGSPVGVLTISDLVRAVARLPADRRSVADVMSHGVLVCQATSPPAAAARAMTERRSRSVVVLDTRGRLAGVLTGADLLGLYSGTQARTVADLMSVVPLTIGPKAALREAADQMLDYGVHRLVVTDPSDPGGFPLGLVSTADISASMANPDSVWQRAG